MKQQEQQKTAGKPYERPRLVVYGNHAKITEHSSGSPTNDSPGVKTH
jgi:hypothetical protein